MAISSLSVVKDFGTCILAAFIYQRLCASIGFNSEKQHI